MESAELPETDLEFAKVLMAGSGHGHRVKLLELRDGSFVITLDGAKLAVYGIGACNLESCIKSFMAFLRSCKEGIGQPPLHPAVVHGFEAADANQ